MRVECRNVSKTFDGRRSDIQALENVSLTVADREFVTIVGPSGCGKTTLLKLIAGLAAPSSGQITLDGVTDGRPQTALVFQDHGLFPWMTVLDNVAFGLEMRGIAAPERRERARAFVARVGLSHFADSYPYQLSIGMQQRVGIIRAFVTDPPVLLMDEPFGALDSQTRLVLQEELLRIWRDDRKVVLFVTHDIDEAIRLSDRILVMSGRPGRIREEIEVPIERPRDLRTMESEVSALKWHVWELMQHEVRKSLWIAE